jgi:hypothetical protein
MATNLHLSFSISSSLVRFLLVLLHLVGRRPSVHPFIHSHDFHFVIDINQENPKTNFKILNKKKHPRLRIIFHGPSSTRLALKVPNCSLAAFITHVYHCLISPLVFRSSTCIISCIIQSSSSCLHARTSCSVMTKIQRMKMGGVLRLLGRSFVMFYRLDPHRRKVNHYIHYSFHQTHQGPIVLIHRITHDSAYPSANLKKHIRVLRSSHCNVNQKK